MCGKSLPRSSRLWCLLALISVLATWSASAQEGLVLELPLPSETESSPSVTPNWDDLEAASRELWQKAEESANQADELRSLLEDFMSRYDNVVRLAREADEAAKQALNATRVERNLWRTAGLAGLGAAAGALVDDSRGAFIGLGLGAVSGLLWSILTP